MSRSTAAVKKFGMCCFSGKVQLGCLEDLPPELYQLYFGDDDHAKKFHENIRRYNSALAFTSVGQDAYKALQRDRSINDGRGPWLYKIKGELHHITGTLLPPEGRAPLYAQLYIYNPDTAMDHRMAN